MPEPWLTDPDVTLYHGDALDVLRELPDASVHMCATSPPFYGLRDYGTEGQIGLEETPDQWVASLVAVFREVWRVLRDDGTLWVEIGHSYNSRLDGSFGNWDSSSTGKPTSKRRGGTNSWSGTWQGAKPKNLLGQPWLLAFALRADGWYLRSEIIWARPNPMPESVTDRPTKSHSTVFLLAKGQWKSRVVALTDLHGELVHLGDHVGPKNPNVWAHKFGVGLATAILDVTQREQQLALPPLDAEIWKQRPGDDGGFPVADLPVEHRAAVYAARCLSANAPAKEFLCELDRLGVALADRDHFKVVGGLSLYTLPPAINRYGERAIAIHDAGEIGELDFTSHTIKSSRPSGCSYFFDADAIREPYAGEFLSSGARNARFKHGGVLPEERRGNEKHQAKAATGEGTYTLGNRRALYDNAPQTETLDGSAGEAPRGPDGRRVTTVKGTDASEQHRDGERWPHPTGANARSVWTIPGGTEWVRLRPDLSEDDRSAVLDALRERGLLGGN